MSSISSQTSVSGAADNTSSTSAASQAASKTALDKDAFLKLLVAQISNQDPLKPMDNTEFVSQLSQFAMVEQAIAQSAHLEKLEAGVQGLTNGNMVDLVGKSVTVDGGSLTFDGTYAATGSATLGGAADAVKATIKDADGNTVRTLDLGKKGAGALSVTWDGRDEAQKLLPAGRYSLSVTATGSNGAPVSVSQTMTDVVDRVSYENGTTSLVLRSGATVKASSITSVGATSTPTTTTQTTK